MIFENHDLYWLSNEVKQWQFKLPKPYWFFNIDNTFNFSIKALSMSEYKSYSSPMAEQEFIDFFAKLFYHYPNVTVNDCDDNSFIPKILKNNINISDDEVDMEDIIVKYYNLNNINLT